MIGLERCTERIVCADQTLNLLVKANMCGGLDENLCFMIYTFIHALHQDRVLKIISYLNDAQVECVENIDKD